MSIQESLYPELTCFGCGNANPHGFHLRSYREGDLTAGEFRPRPEHGNGFGFLNGGIVATVLDCHGKAAVMWEVAKRGLEGPHGHARAVRHGVIRREVPPPYLLSSTAWRTASPVSIDASQIIVRSEMAPDDKVTATMMATWAR